MSRTNRLFLLMDALRGHRRPVTAAVLAERLNVSERTIYTTSRPWRAWARRSKAKPGSAT
ncbi:HTH domain-containing protein [Massilia sp. B-10]|nr:HTH domain-containing protein [Massilia sp. B-10]